MRITEIEINNFRAFYGKYNVKLGKDGKNLMVYGENGSGKSSFYLALKTFFEASIKKVDIQGYENIFITSKEKETAYIQLKIKQNELSSSETTIKIDVKNNFISGEENFLIANANKVKGFLDYKKLLRTYLIDTDEVNLFNLLIKEVLSDQENRFTGNAIGKEWQDIIYASHELKQGARVVKNIKENIDIFNKGVKEKLLAIEDDTNLFIKKFGYNLNIKLSFNGVEYYKRRDIRNQKININIDYCTKTISKHQYFLNEAKLSALAISLYLAAIKSNPSDGALKVLVLDDILIGLDTSNRIPLLDILKEYFQDDYQIIITTYDKVWFELVNNYFGTNKWTYIDFYSKRLENDDFEIPIIKQDTDYIEKAQLYLEQKDYKASAVYVRSKFEKLVKSICNKNSLLVKYKIKSRELKSDDFWNAIKLQTTIEKDFVNEVETYRGTVMNPLSHHDIEKPTFEIELINAIEIIKKLKGLNIKKDNDKTLERQQRQIQKLNDVIQDNNKTIRQLSSRLKTD